MLPSDLGNMLGISVFVGFVVVSLCYLFAFPSHFFLGLRVFFSFQSRVASVTNTMEIGKNRPSSVVVCLSVRFVYSSRTAPFFYFKSVREIFLNAFPFRRNTLGAMLNS